MGHTKGRLLVSVSPFGFRYCCKAVDVLVAGVGRGFFTDRLIGSSSSEEIAKSLRASPEGGGPCPAKSVKLVESSLSIFQR